MNRLFSIVQILRTAKTPVKAQQLAQRLEVSVRTIYRDVAELQMQNVPIVGEAGIGYVLKPGFDLPPLMLTPEELEAAMLGAQWVACSGDRSLAANAQSLLSKIHSVIPEQLQHVVSASTSTVVRQHHAVEDKIDLEALRHAMYQQRKVALTYTADNKVNNTSQRVIWPFKIAYFESVRVIAAWCELRDGFRHFRTDRVDAFTILDERFPKPARLLEQEWEALQLD